MPRISRYKGQYETYHIVQRGNERKIIFKADEDRQRFLETLYRMKKKYNFLIEAYCLMDNHVHLLINDNGCDISQAMKSINISYVYYFNKNYNRCGHLFQDRFMSEMVDNEVYHLYVSKYIHSNPVKAGIVGNAEEYRWSSYGIYTGKREDELGLVERKRVLGILSSSMKTAVNKYVEYMGTEDETGMAVMDTDEDLMMDTGQGGSKIASMEQARAVLGASHNSNEHPGKKNKDALKARDEAIREMRKNSILTLKQIGELFGGLSESRVSRILRGPES